MSSLVKLSFQENEKTTSEGFQHSRSVSEISTYLYHVLHVSRVEAVDDFVPIMALGNDIVAGFEITDI